jgi:hypothetical protein
MNNRGRFLFVYLGITRYDHLEELSVATSILHSELFDYSISHRRRLGNCSPWIETLGINIMVSFYYPRSRHPENG